jgi:hypothetical protein
MGAEIACGTETGAKKNGWIDKLVLSARANMHHQFSLIVQPELNESILDIGASSNPLYCATNYLESNYASMFQITACGLGETNAYWHELYPNVPYIQGTALELPFEDNSFDIAYSHAVIEHVGHFDNQVKMIGEAIRVARKSVWITTPYRWCPMEFHTLLPFIHWLPKRHHRFFLRHFGKKYFSTETTLNLLDRKSLGQAVRLAARSVKREYIQSTIQTSNFFGLPANLLLHICLDT